MTMLHEQKPPLDEDLLKHYGVKGMRWGVRRSDEQLARARGEKVKSPSTSGRVGVDPLTIYGAGIAAFLVQRHVRLYLDSGRKDAKKTGEKEFKKNPELKKKMPVDELNEKVVKQINPGYPEPGTKMNCRRATMAYEMRRRGNDVKATKSKMASGQTPKGMEKAIGTKFEESMWGEKRVSDPKTFIKATPQKKADLIFESLSKSPNGSRGELGVSWMFGGGHSIAWEVVDNKPVVFDTQNGKVYKNSKELAKFTPVVLDAAQTRLDNKTIDDEFIKRWVTDA